MEKFKVGDEVVLTDYGYKTYGGSDRYPKDHIFKVEMSKYAHEGVCVYNLRRRGWVHEGMGLYKCFKLAAQIRIGGE